ncbi:DHA2 family efflux MFS transporter permease subunit [Leuconostoc palmae]|uniref:DHA2 family efflux MFS transporter permease subunit n=1 Tax=Leuconostoc palmae TaxID=501487 RepID=UPI001C7D8998|nr:DHA2 family efflux MFS transporter permease subunit [Leuconostoc palmae]
MNNKQWHVIPAIIASGILSFSGVLIETAMNVTFPKLMIEFHTNANGIQWVTTGYLLAIAVIVPISAYLIRNISTRKLFITANILFLLGVILNGLSFSLSMLLGGRILQGIGTGIALPLMFHIILTRSPKDKRGMMMGIGSMITSLAPAIGPTYGGILLNTLGWRSIFWFLVMIIIISFILGTISIPSESVPIQEKFPSATFILLTIGLGSLLLSIEQSSLILLLISFLALLVFYKFNRQHKIVQLNLFKNNAFNIYMYGFLVYQAILLGLSFILPNYIQLHLQEDATVSGLFMLPGALISALLAPIAGSLLDKLGKFYPIFIGLAISTVALVLLIIVFNHLTFWTLLLLHMFLMIGVGLAYANLMTVSLGALPLSQTADGNSILNTTQQFIGAAATATAAQILTQSINRNSADGIVIGSRIGIICLTTFSILALILFTLYSQYQRKSELT